MHFVDEASIHVQGGDGGDGCLSFRREKFVPKGGPDGGNGGLGGSVIMRADANIATLLDLVSTKRFKAENGKPGSSKNRDGANGADIVVKVPVGTVIIDEPTGRRLKDLSEPDDSVVLARGGRGGRGNAVFATPVNQTPTYWEEGKPGQERYLKLELKLVADVGLVGLPNSGKSTLLSRISAAHPKVADYPFTTLQPQLGIVDTGLYQRFTVADLPGLIRGAHEGKGLGDEFLRHIERTRILVHLVDAAPMDGSDPVDAYHAVRRELELYSSTLAERAEIVAANKMDLPGSEEGLSRLQEELQKEVMPLSAVRGDGIRRLVGKMLESLEEAPTLAEEPQRPEL